MKLLTRVAAVALVFLPACGGCSSCDDNPEQVRATKELSGPIEAPRGSPAPSDSNPARFLRPAFRHRFPHDAGAKAIPAVASDAAIE